MNTEYLKLSPLPDSIKSSSGRKVKIGIVDSGCSNIYILGNQIKSGRNFSDEYTSENYNDYTNNSHGTMVAGIIAGLPSDEIPIIGLCSNAELYIAKVLSPLNQNTSKKFLQALSWLYDEGVEIINCSFNFDPEDEEENIKQFISEHPELLIVASGQDGRDIYSKEEIYYPAQFEGVICVGVAPYEDGMANRNFHPKLNYYMPDIEYTSADHLGNLNTQKGSSFACAFITGNLALLKSNYDKNYQISDLIDQFNNFLPFINTLENINEPKIYKLK